MFDSPDISRRLGCGGTLISDRHIITSIKCVDWDSYPDHILLGDTAVGAEDAPVMTIEVTNYILHEDRSVNIAILEMAEPVPLDKFENIKPVCLPKVDSNFVDYEGTVTGWAYNGLNGYNSWLHKNNVSISEHSVKTKLSGKIRNNSSCFGDTGGPLVVSDPANNNGLTLAGVSDDSDCKIFTKISPHMEWIENIVSGAAICPSPL